MRVSNRFAGLQYVSVALHLSKGIHSFHLHAEVLRRHRRRALNKRFLTKVRPNLPRGVRAFPRNWDRGVNQYHDQGCRQGAAFFKRRGQSFQWRDIGIRFVNVPNHVSLYLETFRKLRGVQEVQRSNVGAPIPFFQYLPCVGPLCLRPIEPKHANRIFANLLRNHFIGVGNNCGNVQVPLNRRRNGRSTSNAGIGRLPYPIRLHPYTSRRTINTCLRNALVVGGCGLLRLGV